jgi:calcium-dependent protein kinase
MKKKQQDLIKIPLIVQKKGIEEDDYIIMEELCSSAFATVCKVKKKISDKILALKIVKKTRSENSKRMYIEIEILKNLIHPNVMQIYEFYEDKKNFYIITEICEGGNLFDLIVNKGYLNEEEAANIIKQILSIVSYINSKNIVHRDLNLLNILLDTNKNNIVKIHDWGYATFFIKNKKMHGVCGSPHYIAPEVLFENYDEKCDVWSCGIILYILLCGYPPFEGENESEILDNIKKGKFSFPNEDWSNISKEAKDLISEMLKFNPQERLSASGCLMHKWFNENQKKIDVDLSKRCLENMGKFNGDRKMRLAVLKYIANNLITNEEKNEVLVLFQSFDKNGDGYLSKEEIFEGYKHILGEEEAKKKANLIMKEIDVDDSGTIDYKEFLIAAINFQNVLEKDKLLVTFKLFDKNRDGSITIEEIRTILGISINEKELLESIVKECDSDGDGEISFNEFKKVMEMILN